MPTYTSQPDDTTGIDTYIYSGSSDTNYGTSNILAAGRQFMRFRLFRNGTIATDTYAGTAYFNTMQMVYTRGSV